MKPLDDAKFSGTKDVEERLKYIKKLLTAKNE